MSKRTNEDMDASTSGEVTAEKSQKIMGPEENHDWREDKGLAHRNSCIFENSFWSDCTFKVDNGEEPQQIFQCHKVILAGASSVFERMFFGPLKETGEITVSDTSPKTFQLLLKYTYTDSLPDISLLEAQDLYIAADKYLIVDLLRCCRDRILGFLNPETAVPIFEFGKHYGCEVLMDNAMQAMRMKTNEVISCDSFIKAEPDTIKALLEKKDLNLTSEKALWNVILRWAECRPPGTVKSDNHLREILQPIFPHFRFLSMTCEEFAEGPVRSNVLTKEECWEILMHKVAPRVFHNFPNNFSSSREKHCSTIFYDVQERNTSITFVLRVPLKVTGFQLRRFPKCETHYPYMQFEVLCHGSNMVHKTLFPVGKDLLERCHTSSCFVMHPFKIKPNHKVTFQLSFLPSAAYNVRNITNSVFSETYQFYDTEWFQAILS